MLTFLVGLFAVATVVVVVGEWFAVRSAASASGDKDVALWQIEMDAAFDEPAVS